MLKKTSEAYENYYLVLLYSSLHTKTMYFRNHYTNITWNTIWNDIFLFEKKSYKISYIYNKFAIATYCILQCNTLTYIV